MSSRRAVARVTARWGAAALLALGVFASDGARSASGSVAAQQTSEVVAAAGERILRGHRAGVVGVAFSPGGEWVASGSLDGTVRLWSAEDGALESEWKHGDEVYAVAFAPDGDLVASSGLDGRVVVWELGSEAPLSAATLPDWSVAIAFSADGTLLVGSTDGKVRRLDPLTGDVRETIVVGAEILGLAVSSDGRRLATGPPIRVWDLETGALLKAVPGHGQGGLAFSPDGTLLAAAEWVAGASVWAAPGFQRVATLRLDVSFRVVGPSGGTQITVNMPAAGVAFSPDGSRLATAGSDRGVQLWDVAGASVRTPASLILTGHTMTVTGVSFSPDSRRLASSSLDGTVRLWDVP